MTRKNITIVTVDTTGKHESTFDLSEESECKKYVDLSVQFKETVKAIQAGDITVENSNEMLEATVKILDREYKFSSDKLLANVEHMKVFASFDEDELMIFDTFYNSYDSVSLRTFEECIKLTLECIKEDIGTLDDKFQANVIIHDYYTYEHKAAMIKIIKLICKDADITLNGKEHRWEITSSDREVRDLLMDLSVSDYCDIEFVELSK